MHNRGYHVVGEEADGDDDGWTVVNKKTTEAQKRLQSKKKKNKQAKVLEGQKLAAELVNTTELETSTIYSKFQDIMAEREEEARLAELAKNPPKKQKEKKERPPPPTAEAVAAGIDTALLASNIKSWETKFKDRIIRLKLLADFFDDQFANSAPREHVTDMLPFKKDFLAILKNFLDSVENDIPQFFVWVAPIALKSQGTGIHTLLQLVLRTSSAQFVEAIPGLQIQLLEKSKFGPVVPKSKSGPNADLIVFCLEQLKKPNPRVALHAWFELLVPSLASSTDSVLVEQILATGETLSTLKYKGSTNVKDAPDAPSPNNVIALIRLFHTPKLIDSLRQRLGAIINTLIDTVVLQPRVATQFFEPLLAICLLGTKDQMVKDKLTFISNLLVRSLVYEGGVPKLWKSIYPAYIQQSNNLLLFIAEQWKEGHDGQIVIDSVTLPVLKRATLHRDLVSCLQRFDNINSKLAAGETVSHADRTITAKSVGYESIGVCRATCRKLESKIGEAPEEGDDETVAQNVRAAAAPKTSKLRLVFTLLLLFAIYYIYTNDVQFADVKDLLKHAQKQIQDQVALHAPQFKHLL